MRQRASGCCRHESGRALDPKLVPLFIEMLPALDRRARPRASRAVETAEPVPTLPGIDGGRAWCRRRRPTRSRTSRWRTARSTRSTRSRSRWAPASASSDTMALISSKLSKIVSWSGVRALPAPARERLAQVPFRGRRRRAEAAERDAAVRARLVGLGGAQPPHDSSTRDPRVSFEAAGLQPGRSRSARRSSARCSSTTRSSAAWRSTTSSRTTTPRITAGCSSGSAEQAGAVIHNSIVFEQTQEDSLTDPLTGLPNRRSMFVHLSRELSRAERLKSEVAHHRDGHRRLQGRSTTPTATTSATTRCARWRRRCRARCARTTLCVRYAGDEFIVVLADCSREAADAKRRELQAKIAENPGSRCAPASGCGSARSAGAAVLPARRRDSTKRCSPTPITCMYRDKTARRGQLPPASRTSPAADFIGPDLFDGPLSARRDPPACRRRCTAKAAPCTHRDFNHARHA